MPSKQKIIQLIEWAKSRGYSTNEILDLVENVHGSQARHTAGIILGAQKKVEKHNSESTNPEVKKTEVQSNQYLNNAEKKTTSKTNKIAIAVSSIIFLTIIVSCGIMMCSPEKPKTIKEELTPELALVIAREKVRDQLLTPSSAEFSNETVYRFTDNERRFRVIGNVDSQNVFGAMLRKTFVIDLEYVGPTSKKISDSKYYSGNWKVHALSIE